MNFKRVAVVICAFWLAACVRVPDTAQTESTAAQSNGALSNATPLAVVIEQFRHAMIDPTALSAGQALGGWFQLVEPLGIVIAIFIVGFWVFNRSAPLIAENL